MSQVCGFLWPIFEIKLFDSLAPSRIQTIQIHGHYFVSEISFITHNR